jgi:hypothetical protein
MPKRGLEAAMSEERNIPDDVDVGTYADVQAEVDKHFEGSWEGFLKAVQNPAEVLHFVLVHECNKEPQKFEAWAKEKKLPPAWVARFYGTLTADGELAADANQPN